MRNIFEWIRDNKGKTIALFIASCYLIFSIFFLSNHMWLYMIFYLTLPLACILFSDAMGDYAAAFRMSGLFPKTSPGCLVALMGWALLLLPLLSFIYLLLFTGKQLYSNPG